jgi:hypothetical protein
VNLSDFSFLTSFSTPDCSIGFSRTFSHTPIDLKMLIVAGNIEYVYMRINRYRHHRIGVWTISMVCIAPSGTPVMRASYTILGAKFIDSHTAPLWAPIDSIACTPNSTHYMRISGKIQPLFTDFNGLDSYPVQPTMGIRPMLLLEESQCSIEESVLLGSAVRRFDIIRIE